MSLGCALVVAGQYIIAHSPEAANAVDRLFGACGRALTAPVAELFPRGIALGLCLFFGGALLIAAVLGFPADGRCAAAPDLVRPQPPAGARSTALLALAMLLSAATALSLAQAAPGTGTLFLWVLALAVGLLAAVNSDHTRRTSFGNPFSRGEWVGMAVLVALDMLWLSSDLTDWHWAGTPDEAFFFAAAKALAEGRLRGFPLSEQGVFGYHPLASSYYQALFMKLFGADIFGWRLSSVAALAGSLPGLYLLTRELWNRRAGWLAAVLFGSAQLAVGYAHFGYNNAQVYPAILGSLAVLSWSVRRRSVAGHFSAGCLAGLGFYTFYSARVTPLLALLLLWSLGAPRRGTAERTALFAGMLLAMLPVLAHPEQTVAHMLQQTAFGGDPAAVPQRSGLWQPEVLGKVLQHWLLSLLYAVWFKCRSNFDWVPVVDPVVAVSAAVGCYLSLVALVRRAPARFLIPAYVLVALVVGAVSQYDCPPLTRLLTLVPFTAMLAAVALDRLWERAAVIVSPGGGRLVGVGLVAAAVIWNIAALQRSMYQRHHGYGDGTTSELIRITRQLRDDCRIIYIQNDQNEMYSVDMILDEYGLGPRITYIRPFGPSVARVLADVQPPFMVVYDLRRAEEKGAVERALLVRFAAARWSDSAPGKTWNLRYTTVPEGLITSR